MTTEVEREAAAELTADIAALPAWTLDEGQLGDLELLLSGAFAPLTGFMGSADVASVRDRGTLADGTPWPAPVTLDVPGHAAVASAARIVLNDPEHTPLAVLDITESAPCLTAEAGPLDPAGAPGRHTRPDGDGEPGTVRLSGPVTSLRPPEHGPFRNLRLSPVQARAEVGDGPVLAFATRRPLTWRQIGQLRHFAGQLRARILLLPLVSGPAEVVVRPEALVRTVQAAARSLPPGTLVVPVPLAPRGSVPARETATRALVAAAYGATHLLTDEPGAGRDGQAPESAAAAQQPVPVLSAGEWAYDRAAEVWRPLALIEPGTERTDLARGELEDLLDRGEEVPAWFAPAAVAEELRRARPPRGERGVVVFFTGLSGSGKSTIARGLRDALAERGDRTVSLLDGDLVRQLLSAGLSFSRADRDMNIARIGYAATEVARHGGVAICAPIAPFADARARARRMVSEVGDFLLIHVATPVEVCEARDRKGLYAKARAGLIDHFTGISDPYELPTDAELTIDTSAVSRQQAVDMVLSLLTKGGWLTDDTAG
ncbi:MAG TPA: adenylyl-sulfate kinase [Streptosporangiaceae bacterium]|nr:adenylyl-sulfate kinase [Streptosporangiaceae bacterium]